VAFGLDVALKDMAGGKDNLILVEGMIDVIALNARGVFNVAAIGGHGKYLTRRRWEALRALDIRQVTLLFDNDQHGLEGTAVIHD
jgi:DNA primase